MQHGPNSISNPRPWYKKLLLVPALLLLIPLLPVIVPILIIALISIPLVWVYPDRHKHIYDDFGSPRQKARLAQWRAAYDRLGLRGRIRRARITAARARARRLNRGDVRTRTIQIGEDGKYHRIKILDRQKNPRPQTPDPRP